MPTPGGTRTYPTKNEKEKDLCKRVHKIFGPKMRYQVGHNCGLATINGIPKEATQEDWEAFRHYCPTYSGYDRPPGMVIVAVSPHQFKVVEMLRKAEGWIEIPPFRNWVHHDNTTMMFYTYTYFQNKSHKGWSDKTIHPEDKDNGHGSGGWH